MTEHVRIAAEDGVLRITLARPDKKNALTQAMYAALGQALARAETDTSVRAVLLEAEGDAFTAGNDLGDFAAVAAGKLARDEMTTHLFLDALAMARKPIVAAVQGLAVGIGVTMLLHCDLVFVADDAKLSTAVRQSRARAGSGFERIVTSAYRLCARVCDVCSG